MKMIKKSLVLLLILGVLLPTFHSHDIEDAEHFVEHYIVGEDNDYSTESVVSASEVPIDHRTWLEGITGEVDHIFRVE